MTRLAPVCLSLVMLAVAAPFAASAGDDAAEPIEGSDFALVELELPSGRPDELAVEIEHDGLRRRLVLQRHSVRAPGFRVQVQRPDGSYAEIAPPAPSIYRGRVVGESGARAFGRLGADGLTARVVADASPDWSIRPTATAAAGSSRATHLVFEPSASIERPVDCPHGVPVPGGTTPTPRAPGTFDGQHLTQIAFDVDYQYYLLKGASIRNCVDAVEAIMNEVDFYYARDLRATYEITHIIVRTSQFYFPTGGGNLLDLFRTEWNTNQSHIVRDMAHLMTDKDNIDYGGLAYVGAMCNQWAYGWSLDSTNIVGHELGHNWGAGHCHDLAPCNNMCGGCFYIAPNTKEIMSAYRDSLTCLDDAGPYPDPLPPYAHPEQITLTRDELAVLAGETFDVLGNDHDGNLDPLAIDAFDAASEQGGTITLSPGSGPGGRDELIYEPPGFVFPGADRFTYTVGDGTGLDQQGSVTIDTQAPRLVGYWKLDDAAGTAAADASNYGRHAATEGDPLWAHGLYDGAVSLDGVDDAVTVPPLQLRSDTVTITAWVNRAGTQNPWPGIVFSRDGSTVAGLSLGTAHELRYHWNGDHWSWDSGLVVPTSQWVFVALVVEPHQATIWLHDGTLQSAVNVASHAIEEFDGVTKLGHDTNSASRRLRGLLDDVRIYDYALTAAEISDLAILGGKAVAPNPVDGGHLVPALGETSWLPGLSADSHDVYFGEDYVAVRDATLVSPEYRGNQDRLELPVGEIDPDAVYAWRVDEIVDTGVIPGDVRLFTRVESGGHWRLDETGGPVADDADGDNDGTYVNGVVLGEPGATPTSGTSVRLDGVDDYVEIPPLNLNRDELTITGWAKRDGLQSNYAGIVFSRAGETVAGISTQVTGDLRYHWNGGYWDWYSGLKLFDGEWAFFALVVRPDMATIYLGQLGVLASASNAALHGEEEFDGPLDLGRDGSVGRYFRGWLDDIRVYRAALSPRDIEGLYSRALAVGAGEVPDGASLPGAQLSVAKGMLGNLTLTWGPSCLASDVDHAVYEGTLGDFTSHIDKTCSTEGATSTTIVPGSGDRYYLVVPLSSNREGSYGRDSAGAERGPGASACLTQEIAPCD
jgi:hypothetical protein